MSVSVKEERIEFRVSKETKETLVNAAKLNNLSLSSYIVSIILKQAKMDLEFNETISLNNKEKERFLNYISKKNKPNKALKKLLK